mgnify:FL=1
MFWSHQQRRQEKVKTIKPKNQIQQTTGQQQQWSVSSESPQQVGTVANGVDGHPVPQHSLLYRQYHHQMHQHQQQQQHHQQTWQNQQQHQNQRNNHHQQQTQPQLQQHHEQQTQQKQKKQQQHQLSYQKESTHHGQQPLQGQQIHNKQRPIAPGNDIGQNHTQQTQNLYNCPPPNFAAQAATMSGGIVDSDQSQNFKFDDEVWYIDGIAYQHARPMAQPSSTGPTQSPDVAFIPTPPQIQHVPWGSVGFNTGVYGPLNPTIGYHVYQPVPFQNFPFSDTRPAKNDGYQLGTPLQVADLHYNNHSNNNSCDVKDSICEAVVNGNESTDVAKAVQPSSLASVEFGNADESGSEENCEDAERFDRTQGGENDSLEYNTDLLSIVKYVIDETDDMFSTGNAGEINQAILNSENVEGSAYENLAQTDGQLEGIKSKDILINERYVPTVNVGRKIRVIRQNNGNREKLKTAKIKSQRSLISSLIKIL